MENAALKRLNDTMGDKETVTALTNLHKNYFAEELELLKAKYPETDFHLYSDFKSIRLAVTGKVDRQIEKDLNEAFNRANSQFALAVKQIEDLPLPPGENPANWFSAGMGETADEAGLTTRLARENPGRESDEVMSFSEVRQTLKTNLLQADQLRGEITGFLPESLKVTIEGNKQIPHRRFFEFLRKKKDLSPEEFMSAFKERFGVELNSSQYQKIIDYHLAVDRFSPGIWQAKREFADLHEAANGGFSADFIGLGADNLFQLSKDMAIRPDNLDQTMRLIREGEQAVTKEFTAKKDRYRKLVEDTIGGMMEKVSVACSGDDCISVTGRALTRTEKETMIRELIRNERPADFRLSFIPDGVEESARTQLAVDGELIEKALRSKITGVGANKLSDDILDNLVFGVDMPTPGGQGGVNLMIGSRVDLSSSERQLIEQALQQVLVEQGELTAIGTRYISP